MQRCNLSKHTNSRPTSLWVLLCLAVLLSLVAVACGVESGDRRPARPAGQIEEFHRTPLGFLQTVSINITKDESGCEVTPSDLDLNQGRVRLRIQNSQDSTGDANLSVPGMEISGAVGPTGFTGSTELDITSAPGPRPNRDFTIVNSGTFDLMCDGEKVGTVNVTDAA